MKESVELSSFCGMHEEHKAGNSIKRACRGLTDAAATAAEAAALVAPGQSPLCTAPCTVLPARM